MDEWMNAAHALCSHSSLGQNDKRMLENMTASNLFKTKLISFSLFAFSSRIAPGIFRALWPHWFQLLRFTKTIHNWIISEKWSSPRKTKITSHKKKRVGCLECKQSGWHHTDTFILHCISHPSPLNRKDHSDWIGFRFGYKSTFSWIVWLLNWQQYFLHFNFLKSSICSENSERSVLF